jgi:hypothetical protein
MIEKEIVEIEKIRDSLLQTFSDFPVNSRDQILFGEWTIKDVIAHINNWMIHDIDCLTALIENKIPFWEPNIDEFNKKGTKLRKQYSWSQLIAEFRKLCDHLLEIYRNYPNNLLSSRIWPDIDETPETFIQEHIDHWQLELKNIQSKL